VAQVIIGHKLQRGSSGGAVHYVEYGERLYLVVYPRYPRAHLARRGINLPGKGVCGVIDHVVEQGKRGGLAQLLIGHLHYLQRVAAYLREPALDVIQRAYYAGIF
jgi:hypothetical protein